MSALPQAVELSLRTVSTRALIVTAVAGVLSVVGLVLDPTQFFRSYLMAFHYWLGLSLGALALWMLHNLTGGAWGVVIRRLLEAATRVLPLLALLFIPLAFGLPRIYEWARPEALDNVHLRHKVEVFLNVPFFLTRTAVYFAIWLVIAYFLNSWSSAEDRAPDRRLVRRVVTFSGPALALHGLAVTFAAVDWIMSLDPHWYSTIFGILVAVGQMLPALGLSVAAACWLAPRKPLADVVGPETWHDLGNLLLAFVMLWTYMSFSQFLLIWAGNLPEEITWYLARSGGGWQWVAGALGLFYFAVPFVLLLSRDIKRDPNRLRWVAVALAMMSLVQQHWMIAPTFSPSKFRLHWLDVATTVAVGGLWLAEFFRQLDKHPLVPIHPVAQEEVLGHV